MMEVLLKVTTQRGAPAESGPELRIAEGTGTLGRTSDNDLVLSDPERVVSGRHARIEVRPDGAYVYDLSTNGTYLNHSPERLPPSQAVQLHQGDVLSLGPYEISVSIEPDRHESESDPFALDAAPLPGIGIPGGGPDILDLLGESGPKQESDLADNPFFDARPLDSRLAGPAPEDSGPRAAEPHRTPVEHVFFRPPETQAPPSPAQEIPEEYDLLGDDAAAEPGPPPEAHPFADPFAEPEPGGARPESVPVGLGEAPPKAEPEPDLAMRPQAPAGDLWAEQAIEMSAPPPVEPQPPAPVVPPQAPEPRPVQAAEAVGPGADLLAAFVRGLGTGDPSQVRDPGALLRDAGALLRALADGLTATMMARARFKSELKLAVTTIRRSENNPFKFSTSADEALERLLLRPNKAFLDPLESARGAFEDIQAHEMAMIAGLRAAMRALLARFEPGALEARMQTASGLDRLLPMARKSRYWELFNQTYGQVAADAAEDFMELFGESFIRAYEDQIARLAQARARSQGRPPD